MTTNKKAPEIDFGADRRNLEALEAEDILQEIRHTNYVRSADAYLTTGTGSGQPTGCLHGIMAALTANGSADTDGIGGANTIGWNDVIQCEQALDPLYRLNARFMLRPSTLSWLRISQRQKPPAGVGGTECS